MYLFIKLFLLTVKYISLLYAESKIKLKHKKEISLEHRLCLKMCPKCFNNYYIVDNERNHFPNVLDISNNNRLPWKMN